MTQDHITPGRAAIAIHLRAASDLIRAAKKRIENAWPHPHERCDDAMAIESCIEMALVDFETCIRKHCPTVDAKLNQSRTLTT